MPIEPAGQGTMAAMAAAEVVERCAPRPDAVGAGADPRTRAVSSVLARRPWWLWPHLLSLDAPLVAIAWQDWWGRAGGTRVFFFQRVILGLGVWMIYLADRLADTTKTLPDGSATARHAFAKAHRRPLQVLTTLIAACLVLLAPSTLRLGQLCGGLILLAGAGIYFWLIHRRGRRGWAAVLPKEAVVGGMFALGTAFFALCRSTFPPGRLAMAVVLFGVTCFLNCALITSWERNACDRHDPFSFLNAFPKLAERGLQRMCWWLTGVSAVVGILQQTTILLPLVLGAFSLGILDRWRHRFSRDALRSLVDAALLTPWLCCGFFAASW